MKIPKNSEIILDEIVALYPFLDKKTLKWATEKQILWYIDRLQEPKLSNYLRVRRIEEMYTKQRRQEFFRKR